MTSEESNARWTCCPMCDKRKCDREADDCDVKAYLKNKAGMEDERKLKYADQDTMMPAT